MADTIVTCELLKYIPNELMAIARHQFPRNTIPGIYLSKQSNRPAGQRVGHYGHLRLL